MPKKEKKPLYATISLYMLKSTADQFIELAKSERRSISATILILTDEALAARKRRA